MNLKLDKQVIVSLSLSEMERTSGGGQQRSDARTGMCGFSRKYGTTYDGCGDRTGCTDATPTW